VSATSELLDFDRRPTRKPWPPPMGQSNLAFALEFDFVVCETLSHGICELLSPSFMDVKFPSYEAILEAMILDFQPLHELETLQVDYQKIPWPRPRNGPYLENDYA